MIEPTADADQASAVDECVAMKMRQTIYDLKKGKIMIDRNDSVIEPLNLLQTLTRPARWARNDDNRQTMTYDLRVQVCEECKKHTNERLK